MRTLILDNEAIDALRRADHPHHRKAMAYYEASRPSRRMDKDRRTVAPTAVRVEAGWSRTSADSAFINRLTIADIQLDTSAADTAAVIASTPGISIADAHVGAVIAACAGQDIAILTSDPKDMKTVAGITPVKILPL